MTIPAGQSLANFTVTIIDDAILEEEELFNLALFIPPFPASLGIHSTSGVATVTITDDDSLTVQFAEFNYSVSEGADEVVLKPMGPQQSTTQWWWIRWTGVPQVSTVVQ